MKTLLRALIALLLAALVTAGLTACDDDDTASAPDYARICENSTTQLRADVTQCETVAGLIQPGYEYVYVPYGVALPAYGYAVSPSLRARTSVPRTAIVEHDDAASTKGGKAYTSTVGSSSKVYTVGGTKTSTGKTFTGGSAFKGSYSGGKPVTGTGFKGGSGSGFKGGSGSGFKSGGGGFKSGGGIHIGGRG